MKTSLALGIFFNDVETWTSRRDASELPKASVAAAELRGGGQGGPGRRQRRSPLQDQLRTTTTFATAASSPEAWEEVWRASPGILRGRGHEPQLTAALPQLQRDSSFVVKAAKQVIQFRLCLPRPRLNRRDALRRRRWCRSIDAMKKKMLLWRKSNNSDSF